MYCYGGRSSVGRAPDCDSGGRGFKPHRPPQYIVIMNVVPCTRRMTQESLCECGGIGRRAGFRYQYLTVWEFESPHSHHLLSQKYACGGRSSVGRAPDCDSGGRGFKPHRPPHFPCSIFSFLFPILISSECDLCVCSVYVDIQRFSLD